MSNPIFRFARRHLFVNAPDALFDLVMLNYRRLKIGLPPRLPDRRNPRRLSDRILHVKRNHRIADAARFCDKLAARDTARERVPEIGLVPLLAVADDPDGIDLAGLPQRFVIKPNHASGLILFCDKSDLDWPSASSRMRQWLALDYARTGHEYQYAGFPRRLMVEADLRDLARGPILDYRFFCTDGVVRFIQTDVETSSGARRDFFDLDWNRLPVAMTVPMSETPPGRPDNLADMLAMAAALSSGLRLARIDLYCIDGVVHFGEFTLHPGGGFAPAEPDAWDERLGSLLSGPASGLQTPSAHLR